MSTKQRSTTDVLIDRLNLLRPEQPKRTKAQTKNEAEDDALRAQLFELSVTAKYSGRAPTEAELAEMAAIEKRLLPLYPKGDDLEFEIEGWNEAMRISRERKEHEFSIRRNYEGDEDV
jgi:hypothetical protein